MASATGLDAEVIRRLARELAAAPTACVYGRIGTTTAEFGTLTSWLVDVLNVLTGNLDRPGGAMFTKAAAGASNTRGKPRFGREVRLHRRTSRVRELPETFGELPAVVMAEEMDTPGEGQIRALVTIAGNPVLSTPNSARLDAALADLECMVSVDIYINETTRHADVILPAPTALQKGHYDLALLQLALHDTANYSEPVLPLDDDQPSEWEVLARLALVLQGAGATADPALVDDLMITSLVQAAVGDETSPIHGRDVDEILGLLAPRTGPERILDLQLRTGPYGEGFGADPDGLSLDVLLANPHGVDLGALKPRLPDVLRTPDGMIALAPELLLADIPRLWDGLDGRRDHPFVLVGRRDLRSNNSWMHNVSVLVKGKPRCTAHLHPDDAAALGAGRRRRRHRPLAGGGGARAGRGHRRHPARGREHPPRVGPRPRRRPARRRPRPRRRQQQPPGRRDPLRPHLGQRRPQRHPRGGRVPGAGRAGYAACRSGEAGEPSSPRPSGVLACAAHGLVASRRRRSRAVSVSISSG